MRQWWNKLRGRHPDGTKHKWIKVPWVGSGYHPCYDYCHHYQVRCTICGTLDVHGYSVEEVR